MAWECPLGTPEAIDSTGLLLNNDQNPNMQGFMEEGLV